MAASCASHQSVRRCFKCVHFFNLIFCLELGVLVVAMCRGASEWCKVRHIVAALKVSCGAILSLQIGLITARGAISVNTL